MEKDVGLSDFCDRLTRSVCNSTLHKLHDESKRHEADGPRVVRLAFETSRVTRRHLILQRKHHTFSPILRCKSSAAAGSWNIVVVEMQCRNIDISFLIYQLAGRPVIPFQWTTSRKLGSTARRGALAIWGSFVHICQRKLN